MGNIAMTKTYPPPAVMGAESIMTKKAHGKFVMTVLFIFLQYDRTLTTYMTQPGTSAVPVQTQLRWNVDKDVADRICNFNRHYVSFLF